MSLGPYQLRPLVRAPDATRGPRGCRIGDVVVAERSRWRVVAIDQARHEAVCSLIAGARVLHRFRARQITRVERQASGAASSDDTTPGLPRFGKLG